MESAIAYLKEQLLLKGEKWKQTQDKETMKDVLALIDAINVLEDRLYGEKITDMTVLL